MQTVNTLGVNVVGGVTHIVAVTLVGLVNLGAQMLSKAGTVAGYIHNAGITAYTLNPVNGSLILGISPSIYKHGMGGAALPAITAFLTGQSNGVVTAPSGVRTQVKNNKLAGMHKKWFNNTCNAIQQVVNGNYGFTNNAVYPWVMHTRANNAHKPCLVYTQYQYIQSALHVILHCRAQHLYMLGYNVQLQAMQLLQICHKLQLPVGKVTLVCNNHHVLAHQNPMAVYTQPNRYARGTIAPNTTANLVNAITAHYNQFSG